MAMLISGLAICKLKHLNIDYLSLCVAMLSFGVLITLNTIIFPVILERGQWWSLTKYIAGTKIVKLCTQISWVCIFVGTKRCY